MQPNISDLSKAAPIRAGIYKDHRGNFFRVLGVAMQEETKDEFVVYRSTSKGLETGEGRLRIRPIQDFYEEVEFRDKMVLHFQFVSEK